MKKLFVLITVCLPLLMASAQGVHELTPHSTHTLEVQSLSQTNMFMASTCEAEREAYYNAVDAAQKTKRTLQQAQRRLALCSGFYECLAAQWDVNRAELLLDRALIRERRAYIRYLECRAGRA